MTKANARVSSAFLKCALKYACAFVIVGPFAIVDGNIATNASHANEPILVVVRKKAEAEKSIPMVTQTFRKNDISRMRLQSPTDLSAIVSGFSFNDPFGRFNPAPSMRGLIQPGLGDEPSVAFFNDGMYLSGRSSINSLSFDLERIEVAKGPQNALYGRNSFGGAINAISALPTQNTERYVDITAGEKNRMQATGVVSGPINDKLSARIAAYVRDWGGYFDNANPNGPEIGREQTQAARITLRGTPAPDSDVVLRLTHIHDHDSQPKGFLVPANCGPRIPDNVLRYYCGEVPESDEPYSADAPVNGYERMHTRLSVDWTQTINDNLTSFVMLGGSTENSEFARDDDFSSTPAAIAGINTRRFDMQGDARLTYQPDARNFSLLGGVSLYHFNNHNARADQYIVLGQTGPGGAISKALTDTAALYGNISVPLRNNVTLSLDGRYQIEWKDFKSTIRDPSGEMLDLKDSWSAFTPKATISWQRNPESLLVYASAAQGYKSGGFNDRQNLFDNERAYGPEHNWTYELGMKNIPLRENLSADLGAFYIDWQNQQVLAYSAAGATNNFFLSNSAQSRVKGIETALNWTWGDTTRLGLHYTYADARFVKYNDPDLATIQGFDPDGDVSGNRLPRYSPHHVGFDIEDRRPLTDDLEWVNTAQFSFQSSQYTDNGNLAENGHRSLLNLQTGVELGNAYAGFYIDNALDERDPPVGISWSDARTGFSRAWLVTPQDGRTIGIRTKFKF